MHDKIFAFSGTMSVQADSKKLDSIEDDAKEKEIRRANLQDLEKHIQNVQMITRKYKATT